MTPFSMTSPPAALRSLAVKRARGFLIQMRVVAMAGSS